MKLKIRRLIGKIANCFLKKCGKCYRCGRQWQICKEHLTPYIEGHSCFPLCEECWQELTPQTRLPFYRELWELWNSEDENDNGVPYSEIWRCLKISVLDGQ